MSNKNISIPEYSLGEEIFNAASHGIGALLGAAGLVLMVIKAHGALEETTVTLFGAAIIILYTISCVYHSLSANLKGKKVLRVIDHCNVFLLVFGTYIPIALLGVGGTLGWVLFGIVAGVTALGVTLSAIDVDKFVVMEVICHLINGWSILIGTHYLLENLGHDGFWLLLWGGIAYSLGSFFYAIGHKKKYTHCVFHVFCLIGTLLHFFAVYLFAI